MTKNVKTWICKNKPGYAPYIFIAPFVFIFCAFMIYPMGKSIYLAFTATNGPKSVVWIGLDNFRFLMKDTDFWLAVKNTSVYAFFSLFLQLPLSLGLAVLLNKKWVKGRNALRFVFFIPNLIGQVFVAVLFNVLFFPRFGLVNRALAAVVHAGPAWFSNAVESWWIVHFGSGVVDSQWLNNADLVMPALILSSMWIYVGFNMIYFLAALQAVDKQLYDAAAVDGASSWRCFLHVTLPGIKPVLIFVMILSTIGSFQLFALPYVLLSQTSGPNQSGLTIVMYLFQTGFRTGDLGYASAVGWMLVIIILIFSLIQLFFSGTLQARK
ncbi:MAG: sugar ABC transporter permease [Planctomycetota bacterium]